MKRTLIGLLALMVIGSAGALAATPAKTFVEGVQAYEKGEFSEAADRFSAIASKGVRNGDLFYNLGNAYMKMGDLGRARLWYERAARLIPRDPDLNFNRDYAASRVLDAPEENPGGLRRVLFFWYYTLSPETLKWAALGVNALFWILVLVRRIAGRKRFGLPAGTLAVLALVLALSVGTRYVQDRYVRYGIVIPPRISVRSGLSDKSTELFALHAGTRARIDAERKEGFRIRFSEGKIGWVRRGDLEPIE